MKLYSVVILLISIILAIDLASARLGPGSQCGGWGPEFKCQPRPECTEQGLITTCIEGFCICVRPRSSGGIHH